MYKETHNRLKKPIQSDQAGIALFETVTSYMITGSFQLKTKAAVSKTSLNILFLIDSSGSMMKDQQIASMKGLIEKTILKYQHQTLKFAAIALHHNEASLVCPLTTNHQQLLSAVTTLTSGGKTNLTAGFKLIHQLMKTDTPSHHLYIFTDGKINAGATDHPFEEAMAYYQAHLNPLKKTTVIDSEQGFIKLNRSQKLASALGASYLHLTPSTA